MAKILLSLMIGSPLAVCAGGNARSGTGRDLVSLAAGLAEGCGMALARQQKWVARELESEKPQDRRGVSVLEMLRSGRMLLLGAVSFLAYLPARAAIFWTPTLLNG